MKKSSLALITVLIATVAILILVFGKVIQSPSSYIFSTSEDAVKSYFNFSYYLKYDEGIRHDGINYPYGDHLQYINSHPLYVQILKFVDAHIFPLSEKGVGIMNLSMIISLLLAIPFLFLILRKFALPPWYAAILSLIILFLSPQLDRLGGHFEMVYAFFIPLYWYLLIRWHEGRQRGLWTTLLLLTALVGGFTSAYIVAFLAVFPMAVVLVQVWNKRRNLKSYLPEGLYLLAIAIAPLVMVKGLVSITDWVDDRPDNPWGFFIFHSNIFSIFLPPRSVLREVLHGVVDFSYQWEGRAYVGFPPLLLALGTFLWLGLHLFSRKKIPEKTFNRKHPVNLYLAAGIIVLIFSMCIPFKWFRFLAEILPPLKQFRCLGRFSWIFYYIFSAYTALFIYRYYRLFRAKGHKITVLVVVILLLSYWSIEAGLNLRSSTKNLFNQNNIVTLHESEMERAFSETGRTPDDYQSILFLPYASTCGDKLLFTRGMHAFSQAMKCSYQSGLPLIQSFSPRLSFTHAMSSIQLLADSSIFKQRTRDMNEKDILVVHTREELNAREQSILDRSSPLWSGPAFSLFTLPVGAFNLGYENWEEEALRFADSLNQGGRIISEVSVDQIHYEDFEDQEAGHSFTGKGARYLKKGKFDLFSSELYTVYGSQPLEFSFWLFTDHRTDNMPLPELLEWDKEGQLLRSTKLESRAIHEVDGLWVRISHSLVPGQGINYQLSIRGKYITVDDLLMKPAGAKVAIMENKQPVLFNNYRIHVDP